MTNHFYRDLIIDIQNNKTDDTEIKLIARLQRVIVAENMAESGLDKWTVEGRMKGYLIAITLSYLSSLERELPLQSKEFVGTLMSWLILSANKVAPQVVICP